MAGAHDPVGDESIGIAEMAREAQLRTRDGCKTWQPMLHAMDNPNGLHLYSVRAIGTDLYIFGEHRGCQVFIGHARRRGVPDRRPERVRP